MRRRLAAILLLIVISSSACMPKTIEPDLTEDVFSIGNKPDYVEPAASTAAFSALQPTPKVSMQPENTDEEIPEEPETAEEELVIPVTEPSAEVEDNEDKYVETVAVPDGTPTSLGVFIVTAYCDCVKCNGKWTGHKLNTPTQAGVSYPVEGYTISVDPEVISLGSVVELEGLGARYAQDTGSAIKGKRIDLFFGSHEEALEFGVQKMEVWVYM